MILSNILLLIYLYYVVTEKTFYLFSIIFVYDIKLISSFEATLFFALKLYWFCNYYNTTHTKIILFS
jgi:hypothetical protein